MIGYIEKLQQKQKEYRVKILIISVAIIMTIIIGVWWTISKYSGKELDSSITQGPLNALWNSMKNIKDLKF